LFPGVAVFRGNFLPFRGKRPRQSVFLGGAISPFAGMGFGYKFSFPLGSFWGLCWVAGQLLLFQKTHFLPWGLGFLGFPFFFFWEGGGEFPGNFFGICWFFFRGPGCVCFHTFFFPQMVRFPGGMVIGSPHLFSPGYPRPPYPQKPQQKPKGENSQTNHKQTHPKKNQKTHPTTPTPFFWVNTRFWPSSFFPTIGPFFLLGGSLHTQPVGFFGGKTFFFTNTTSNLFLFRSKKAPAGVCTHNSRADWLCSFTTVFFLKKRFFCAGGSLFGGRLSTGFYKKKKGCLGKTGPWLCPTIAWGITRRAKKHQLGGGGVAGFFFLPGFLHSVGLHLKTSISQLQIRGCLSRIFVLGLVGGFIFVCPSFFQPPALFLSNTQTKPPLGVKFFGFCFTFRWLHPIKWGVRFGENKTFPRGAKKVLFPLCRELWPWATIHHHKGLCPLSVGCSFPTGFFTFLGPTTGHGHKTKTPVIFLPSTRKPLLGSLLLLQASNPGVSGPLQIHHWHPFFPVHSSTFVSVFGLGTKKTHWVPQQKSFCWG